MTPQSTKYGSPRLTVELTNICNLRCSYCLRDEDALYNTSAQFLSVDLLNRVLAEARETMGLVEIGLTGGEPTLHPEFSQILQMAGKHGLTASFVTNGWHFERIWPAIVEQRDSVSHVAFSLDGVTAEDHDRWRGEGSFTRLVRAFSRCYAHGLPLAFKVGIRRDTMQQLEQIAMFAARMGAARLSFSHIMPTSNAACQEEMLSLDERREAEEEIASLARIFRMKIAIDVGYFNLDPAPPCVPLAGTGANIDYQGRLTLCCNLSGFRGAIDHNDVIADLNKESFAIAHKRLRELAESQLQKRQAHLAHQNPEQVLSDLYSASPCLFCLKSFGKFPWLESIRTEPGVRTLPVVA